MAVRKIITPPPLKPGDCIAICSPAGAVAPDLFAPAIELLERQGWRVRVMPRAMGRSGTYSAPPSARITEMVLALTDPEVRAVLCGRGGYGAAQLLDCLADLPLASDPKWLIGFSDITAMHQLWQSKGVASVHSMMLRGLAQAAEGMEGAIADAERLFAILRGEKMDYAWPSHPLNREGECEGRLVGGNLSVMAGLIGTPYFSVHPGDVLVIEDIGEPIYKLDRIMQQLRMAGVLPKLGGIIAGRFTNADPDPNYASAYEMIAEIASPYGYPIAMAAPIGHGGPNLPLLLGQRATLKVEKENACLA